MQDPSVRGSLLARFPGSLDFGKIAATGHSLGGATAATITSSDKRVLGGVDIDGELFDPIMTAGLSKPFMLLGRQGHAEEDGTWDTFYSHLRGTAAELAINGTMHWSYMDILTLLGALNLPDQIRPVIQEVFGTIDPGDLDRSLTGAMVAFLELLFKGDKTQLKDVHERFPSVSIVKSKVRKGGAAVVDL